MNVAERLFPFLVLTFNRSLFMRHLALASIISVLSILPMGASAQDDYAKFLGLSKATTSKDNKVVTPSCTVGKTEILKPVGYSPFEYAPEIAYYVTIKANCAGDAVVEYSERGKATHDSNVAELRAFIGPPGIEPVRELCRAKDGNETPPTKRPKTPPGYWPGGDPFSNYQLACQDTSGQLIKVPVQKGETIQFTFLRWNKHADPSPVSQNMRMEIRFTPK